MNDVETNQTKAKGEGTEPASEAGSADGVEGPPGEAVPAVAMVQSGGSGTGLRLLAAAVTLPWLVLYGITGAWAVARAARAYGEGLRQFDAGYTRFVTPGELVFVGTLLLAAFAVLLTCALLLIFRRRSVAVWLPELLVAAGLTAGSVWAAVRGGLHPILWVLFFFGLAYVAVIALVIVVKVTRASGRGRIVSP